MLLHNATKIVVNRNENLNSTNYIPTVSDVAKIGTGMHLKFKIQNKRFSAFKMCTAKWFM